MFSADPRRHRMAENRAGFPTVLVAEQSDGIRALLTPQLQSQGYFVLQARNEAEALDVVRIHSRPIHLMLTNGSPDGRALALTVKQYRRQIIVLFVTANRHERDGDLFSPDEAVLKVRELVSPPRKED